MSERYKDSEGNILRGVTTIINEIIAKPALIHWAWKLGMEGKDYQKERDKAADVGTVAHYLIKCHLKKEEPKLDEYSKSNIDKAKKAFEAFLAFEKQNNLETILIEKPLVSEIYKYGGTPDWYGLMNGDCTLIDFKTGKRLYPEFKLQISAYKQLLIEQDYTVRATHLLQIDKETGEFHHFRINELDDAWAMFKLLLQIYPLKNRIWKK